MKKEYLFAGFIGLLVAASYLPLFLTSENVYNRLTAEDHIYENMTAIFYFIGGVILIFLWYLIRFKTNSQILSRPTGIFILLLGLFLVFCCMEEISWGQRIFNIKSPELMLKDNDQRELNIHNLHFFSTYTANHHFKHGIMKWFSAARLYALFWLVYCVIIPISDLLLSGLNKFYKKIGLPVVLLWLGLLFPFNHIVAKIVERFMPPNDIQNITEIKECAFSFLFLLVSISFFIIYRKRRQLSSPQTRNH